MIYSVTSKLDDDIRAYARRRKTQLRNQNVGKFVKKNVSQI